jgi:hypothetical protein
MKNAYEFRERYSEDGKRTLREWAIGPIVPWCLVVLVALLIGKVLNVPSTFWQLFKL